MVLDQVQVFYQKISAARPIAKKVTYFLQGLVIDLPALRKERGRSLAAPRLGGSYNRLLDGLPTVGDINILATSPAGILYTPDTRLHKARNLKLGHF